MVLYIITQAKIHLYAVEIVREAQNRDKLCVLNKIPAIYNPYQNNEICFSGFSWASHALLERKMSKCYPLLGENNFRDL